MATSRSGSGKGRGRHKTESAMLKIAVFAPIPSASVSTATAVKPGFFSSWRKANLRSFILRCVIYDWRTGETPNPKHQAPKKSQAPNPKWRSDAAGLELGIWSFIDAWILVFGVFIHISAPPLDRLLPRGARAPSRPAERRSPTAR